MIDNDVLTSQIECFAKPTKIVDVDDDDEYMNAAAAHAAFVMTVSTARMYWLLRHAHLARDISFSHFPNKNRLGLCQFSVQWNR